MEKTTQELDNILTKEYLLEEHVKNKKTAYEIAKVVGCDRNTVQKRLIKYNLLIEKVEKLKDNICRKDKKRKCLLECCNNYFITSTYLNKRYCSVKCRNTILLGNNNFKGHTHTEKTKQKMSTKKIGKIGKNCNAWKGGITPLHMWIRGLSEYWFWQKSVLERDNYTCQGCNSNQNLETHHIYEFHHIFQEFLQLYNQFSPIEEKEILIRLASKYNPFWDVNNGKTLCYDCHNIIHTRIKINSSN